MRRIVTSAEIGGSTCYVGVRLDYVTPVMESTTCIDPCREIGVSTEGLAREFAEEGKPRRSAA